MAIEPLEPGVQLLRSEDRRYRYKIGDREASRSGFMLVYQAMDRHIMTWVRIKELAVEQCGFRKRPDPMFRSHDRDTDDFHRELMHRIEDEVHALAQIHSPNVMRILDNWREHGTTYVALEDRRDLQPLYLWRPTTGGTPWERVGSVLEDYLDGLLCLHAMRLVHGDVQPATLAVTTDGTGVLYDFGTARANYDIYGKIETMPWPIDYAAPEMDNPKSAGHVGPWSDLYSWAMIVYGLTVGHPTETGRPILARDRLHTAEGYEDAAENLRNAGLPDAWVDAVTACLSLDPDERPRSAEDVKGRVKGAGEGIAIDWREVAIEAQQTSEEATNRANALRLEKDQLKLRADNLEDNAQMLNETVKKAEGKAKKLTIAAIVLVILFVLAAAAAAGFALGYIEI